MNLLSNLQLKFLRCLFLSICLLISACNEQPDYIEIQGYTMGTTYTIKTEDLGQAEALKTEVEKRLKTINQLMSTYIDNSELSVFNRTKSTECLPLSEETLKVINAAQTIADSTNGKFDVTLAPLIELWGFDKKETHDRVPTKEEIQAVRASIGFEKVRIEKDCVAKNNPSLSINLSAIAKGYGVDQIAKAVAEAGHKNYMVEIGGEIALRGLSNKGKPWRIAIESASSKNRSIQKVISPGNLSIATSGDYRNYFEKDGVRYSHTIDPTTGFPITHSLASITVLHPQAMMADGIATAMMVMGETESLQYAEENDLPIFMLVKQGEQFKEVYSSAFEKYIKVQ